MEVMETQTSQSPTFVEPQGGQHYHFLNHLATVKVAGGVDGQLSVVEFEAPRGFGPPLHRHNHEDELFVILDGEVTFTMGDVQKQGPAGTLALLPRAIPHGFQVISDGATILNVTGSAEGPPLFDKMVAALGTPLASRDIPGPEDIDPGLVAEVCASLGIDILGPPPPPLD